MSASSTTISSTTKPSLNTTSENQTSTSILSERSPNTRSSPSKAATNDKPTLIMDHAKMPRFEINTNTIIAADRSGNENEGVNSAGATTYISPSDAIRSPTTKKLSQIKGRRYQNAKPSNLFAKTLAMERFKAKEAEVNANVEAGKN